MENKIKYILNANIISKDKILNNYGIKIEKEFIKKIFPMDEFITPVIHSQEIIYFDAEGAYLSAGFIDIHSDNIETVVQPRPQSLMDFKMALVEIEKQLVNQGITTMYHSLSFIKNSFPTNEKVVRTPDNMRKMAKLIYELKDKNHLIRHRFHCRFDLRNCEGYETLLDYIDNDYVHLLSFIDHTPGQGQYRNLEIYKNNLMSYHPEKDEAEIDKMIEDRMLVPKLSNEKIENIAEKACEKKIPIASHDDDTIEKLEYVNTVLKSEISEFPVELEVAKKAKEKGMFVVLGAPNALMGKSHSGNLSATEAIIEGLADILVSDYYPSSMLHAVFKLYYQNNIPLWQGMNMITLNPAKAVGVDEVYGSVEIGKKADLLLIKTYDEKPYITKVFIDGQLVSELNYRRAEYA